METLTSLLLKPSTVCWFQMLRFSVTRLCWGKSADVSKGTVTPAPLPRMSLGPHQLVLEEGPHCGASLVGVLADRMGFVRSPGECQLLSAARTKLDGQMAESSASSRSRPSAAVFTAGQLPAVFGRCSLPGRTLKMTPNTRRAVK